MSDISTTGPAGQVLVNQSSFPTNKMAFMRLTILIIKTIGSGIIAALMGVDWIELSGQQKLLMVIALVVNVATAIESFFDKTMSRLAEGKSAKAAATGNTAPPFATSPASI